MAWSFESTGLLHRHERVLPSADVQLVFNLHEDSLTWFDGFEPGDARAQTVPGAAVNGPYDRPFCIDTRDQRRIVGVVLPAGTAQSVLGVPVNELVNTHIDVEALPVFRGLRARMGETPWDRIEGWVDQELAARLGDWSPPAWVGYAVAALEGGVRVREVQRELGWGAKGFRRRFEAEVGLAPKRFQQVARLRRVLASVARSPMPPGGWAEVALEAGYADQAHFVRDFKRFTGETPTAYCPRSPQEEGHVPIFFNT